MTEIIKVRTTEKVRQAKLLKMNAKTVIVMLPDGNIVKRHKEKHLVDA